MFPHQKREFSSIIKIFFFTTILIIISTSHGGSDGGDSGNTASTKASQTYLIGSTSRTFDGSPGSPGSIPVAIYYPAENDAVDTGMAEGRFPLVIFSHGYQQAPIDYGYVWESLVPAGYIVALLDKLSSAATIDIDAYAADINFVLEELYNLDSSDDPVLGSHIETTSALLGHSTGGGATIIAAANSTTNGSRQATTLAILAPLGQTYLTITGTDSYTVAGDAGVPTLVFAGARDCICPPESHASLIYHNLDTAHVNYLLTITDGDHCGFSDVNGPGKGTCEIAESTACLTVQGDTINSAEQNTITAEILKPWLDRFLKGDSCAWLTFQQRINDGRLSVESSGPIGLKEFPWVLLYPAMIKKR